VPSIDDATDDLIDHFVRQAERAASIVHICHDDDEVGALIRKLAAGGRISVSNRCVERYPDLVADLGSDDLTRPGSAAEAAEAVVGVTVAEGFVVETGSVLVAEPDLQDRLVSMLSPTVVQIVSGNAMFPGMDEVGAFLTARHDGGIGGYHALVTGPSRSADIERSLTIGVQGPSEVHVVLLFSGRGEPSR
jgi:L-lactate dehydrogenase complex protein LldG